MTTSSYTKMFTQLKNKPVKMAKYLKHNTPKQRKYGPGSRRCVYCGRTGAHIKKYGLNLCRQCFRDYAPTLGFKKYS